MTSTRSSGFTLAALLGLSACTGAVSRPAEPGAPQGVQVDLQPPAAQVAAGGSVSFVPVVTGTADTRVTWSVQEGAGCGSVTGGGVYTAPQAAATCHVVATSVADPSRSGIAAVTVLGPPPPVTVTVSPATASVYACQTLTFTATVTGTSNGAVTWSVQEGAAGGTATPGGVYTAPDAAGTYHVVATSQADPARSATAVATVTDRILSVQIAPSQATVQPGGSAQFTATVTTTCGTFASTQTVQAPGAGPN